MDRNTDITYSIRRPATNPRFWFLHFNLYNSIPWRWASKRQPAPVGQNQTGKKIPASRAVLVDFPIDLRTRARANKSFSELFILQQRVVSGLCILHGCSDF